MQRDHQGGPAVLPARRSTRRRGPRRSWPTSRTSSRSSSSRARAGDATTRTRRRGRRRRADHLRQPRRQDRRAVLERPVPRPARAHHPAHPGVQADAHRRPRTGAATRRTRSCSASTAPRGRPRTTLDAHLHRLEEAEKRDHRKLGAELDLFSFPDEIGSGLAVFHPKGGIVRRVMEDYSRQRHEEAGYEFVNTPHITKAQPVRDLGPPRLVRRRHVPADGARRRHGLLPQADELPVPHPDLPSARPRRYRELPLRLFEFGTVYRYEKSGVVHGLTRVARLHPGRRAHLLHPGADGRTSSRSLLDFVLDLLRDYGLDDFYLELSTKDPEKCVGTDEDWDEATEALRAGGRAARASSSCSTRAARAFYGPKISVQAATRSAAPGRCRRSRSTSTCPALRPASTSAPTTSATGRS